MMPMKFPVRYNEHRSGLIGVTVQVQVAGCVEFLQAAKGARPKRDGASKKYSGAFRE